MNTDKIYIPDNDEDYTALIERIKRLRSQELKLNRSEFASKLGFSQSLISMIENGTKKLSETVLNKIIYRFNVNPDWLKGNSEATIFNSTEDNTDDPFLNWYLSLPPKERDKYSNLFFDFIKFLNNYGPES